MEIWKVTDEPIYTNLLWKERPTPLYLSTLGDRFFQRRLHLGCEAAAKRLSEIFMIDLKAMLVEREDCDAGTVQQLRNALAQGGNQYRTLRDITEVLEKKAETATGTAAKRRQLKLGISLFFLGHLSEAIEHLKLSEGALANFYLVRALADRLEYDEAIKAFERAEKAGYTASQVQLQKPGILRHMGGLTQALGLVTRLSDH